jgi:hypothetical protein
MLEVIKKYRKKKSGEQLSLEGYLLSKNYIIHDVKNNGKTVVYNSNMKTVVVIQKEVVEGVQLGSVSFDVNGDVLLNLNFIPNSLTMFDGMLRQAIRNKELTK